MASPDHGQHPKPWERLRTEAGPDLSIFRARFDIFRHPRTQDEFRGVVLETPDWANVVALTPDREVVLIRQFRLGVGRIALEIPGGTVDEGEDHGTAARRELVEETGYTAPEWTYLGFTEPNAAFHDNRCHHWLAEEAQRTEKPRLDGTEEIHVETADLEFVRAAVLSGEIPYSLVVSALSRVLDLRTHDLDLGGDGG